MSPRAVVATRAVAAAVTLTAAASALQHSASNSDARYSITSASVAAVTRAPVKPGGPLKTPPLSLPPGGGGGTLASPPLGASPGGSAPLGGPPPGAPGSPTTPPAGAGGAPGTVPGAPVLDGAAGQDWHADTKCPDWPEPLPQQKGGLSSMINLAPMAGPFMSEAFALGSVYQPVLSVAGPLLAEIEPVITANLPWINPLIQQVQAVEAVVLEAILPYYGPYRQQLLRIEGDIARDLAPVLQRLASTRPAVCFVAWQAKAIRDAKGGRLTVASLAHPGERVRLSPDGKAERVR